VKRKEGMKIAGRRKEKNHRVMEARITKKEKASNPGQTNQVLAPTVFTAVVVHTIVLSLVNTAGLRPF